MKIGLVAVFSVALLSGCAAGSKGTCEVFSPAAVAVPTTQNDQRVETNASGDATRGRNQSQDCGS